MLLVSEEVLIAEGFDVMIFKGVAFTEDSHFIDILESHTSLFVTFSGLVLILLILHPLDLVTE